MASVTLTDFALIRRRRKWNKRKAMTKIVPVPTPTPTRSPALPPPENPEDFELEDVAERPFETLVEVDIDIVEEPVEVDACSPNYRVIVMLFVVLQQEVSSPQHQVVEFANPSQGVFFGVPPESPTPGFYRKLSSARSSFAHQPHQKSYCFLRTDI